MAYPKKPTALKVLQGTVDKSRENKHEAKPPLALPEPPEFLKGIALEHYKMLGPRLVNCGLLTNIDGDMLAAYCNAYGMFSDAVEEMEKFKANGGNWFKYDSDKGNEVQRVLVGVINQTRKAMQSLAAEFGMSPAQRSKVVAKKQEETGNPFNKL